jgi:hypothetical protein
VVIDFRHLPCILLAEASMDKETPQLTWVAVHPSGVAMANEEVESLPI